MRKEQGPQTLTISEAQERLGVSRTTLWRILRAYQIGTLTDVLDTRVKRVRAADIDKVLEDAARVRRGIAA